MKKTAASKRASVPRACDYAKVFLKDWVRLSHSGRYDMVRLKEAMLLLIANDARLALNGLTMRLKAIGLTISNAILVVTFCWCASLKVIS